MEDGKNHNQTTKHKRTIRLKAFDYADAGFYSITICTQDRRRLFGRIRNGRMKLNRCGYITRHCIREVPHHWNRVRVYASIIMPDHVHLIIHIMQPVGVGAQFIAPANMPRTFGDHRGAMNRAPTLGSVVRGFKARCTNTIHRMGYRGSVWQRNNYEPACALRATEGRRVIRNERELFDAAIYIKNNPRMADCRKRRSGAVVTESHS